jgi:hypothetical protein
LKSPISPIRGTSRRLPLGRSLGRPGTRKGLLLRESRKQRKLSKAIPTFNVFAKVGRRFVRISKGQLTRADALNKGAYAVDHTTAKTFKIVPAGRRKKVQTLPKVERNYYRRASYKLRPYRIKRGRKFGIIPKYIEKRKYGIDTRGEKRGLTIAKYLKARGVTRRASTRKVRITGKRRKSMLRNLAKARRALSRRRR